MFLSLFFCFPIPALTQIFSPVSSSSYAILFSQFLSCSPLSQSLSPTAHAVLFFIFLYLPFRPIVSRLHQSLFQYHPSFYVSSNPSSLLCTPSPLIPSISFASSYRRFASPFPRLPVILCILAGHITAATVLTADIQTRVSAFSDSQTRNIHIKTEVTKISVHHTPLS
jgi:hypothetical protein